MRSMIVLAVLGVTACGQMSASTTGESTALGQTKSTAWQDEDGKMLSAAQVEEAYRACQDRMFSGFQSSPFRASEAIVTPLYDEHVRLALSDPELNVCMQSFGYSRVDSPTGASQAVPGAAAEPSNDERAAHRG
jgi:hypothetical protein